MRMSRRTVKKRSIIRVDVKPQAASHIPGDAQDTRVSERKRTRYFTGFPPKESARDEHCDQPLPSSEHSVRQKYESQWGKHKVQHPEKFYAGWETEECSLEVQGVSMVLAHGPAPHHLIPKSSEVSASPSTTILNSSGICWTDSPKNTRSSFRLRKKMPLFRPQGTQATSVSLTLPTARKPEESEPLQLRKSETQIHSCAKSLKSEFQRSTKQQHPIKVLPIVKLTKIESTELESSSGDETGQVLQQLRSSRSPRSSLLSVAPPQTQSALQPATSHCYSMQTAEVLKSTKSLIKRRTETFNISQRLFKHIR